MKVLLVRMPPAAARDKLAIAAELCGNSEKMRNADLVIGFWGNDDTAVLVKDRHQMVGEGTVTVVKSASILNAEALQRTVDDSPKPPPGIKVDY